MEKPANWRNGSRNTYSDDFKLHMVELASRPSANVSQIARDNSVGSNLIRKRTFTLATTHSSRWPFPIRSVFRLIVAGHAR